MARCVAEIDSKLPDLGITQSAYPVTVAEASLPYLRNCVKENFRITPVFTMPLARRVMAPEGVTIAGQHIPRGVSSRPFPATLPQYLRPSPSRSSLVSSY